jgi:hypothetical protein
VRARLASCSRYAVTPRKAAVPVARQEKQSLERAEARGEAEAAPSA